MNTISVIVAIYNVEDYLEKCINSIINQTYKNLEILLINDGSTDKSGEICNRFAKLDARIKVFHQPNSGIASVRKAGIKYASGDYIGFVDGDDWIYPDMYELLYKNITATKSDISVCGMVIGKGFSGCNEDERRFFEDEFRILTGSSKLYEVIENTNNSYCNKLFKPILLKKLNIPEGKIYEDAFSMYLLFDKAEKVVFTQNKGYYYTYRSSSISHISTIKQFDVVEAYTERLEYITKYYQDDFNLIVAAKKSLWYSFLANMSITCRKFLSETEKRIIENIINRLKLIDYHNCDLSEKDVYLLSCIFNNLEIYFQLIKYFSPY